MDTPDLTSRHALQQALDRMRGAMQDVCAILEHDVERAITAMQDAPALQVLYFTWGQVSAPNRVRFLLEMLTPEERCAIQTGLWPDGEGS